MSTDTAERLTAPPRATLLVVCVALAAVVSAVASLNVAIPSIAADTHASQTELSWVIDAYSLVFAALLLPAGALGDRYGRRRALLAGLAIFGAGSVAAMAYADAHWLIAMRAVLGIGAALVMPATLSTITSTFPDEMRARAVGTWAGVAGGSAILGLLTSGIVLQIWSWRSVFALSAVLAVLAIAGTRAVVPESADPHAPPVDRVGAVMTAVGLGILVYSIIEAPTQGWASMQTIAGMAAGILVLAGFVVWELRLEHPLLDPRLFVRGGVSAGTLTVSAQFFVFFGFIFILLQYLQLVAGYGPLDSALRMVPLALGLLPAARGLAPRMAERIGSLRTSALGLAIAAVAFGLLSRLDATTSYGWLVLGLVPLGIGMGLAMTPATAAITDALPAEQQGVGSALNDLARELGGALGIAVLGSILASTYRDRLSGFPAPARESLALARRLGPTVAGHAEHAFVDGLQHALLAGSALLVVVAIAVVVLGRRSAT
jgi:EmrB/QacA subfamily drug resistance transporter